MSAILREESKPQSVGASNTLEVVCGGLQSFVEMRVENASYALQPEGGI